jgi:hypothetical protein
MNKLFRFFCCALSVSFINAEKPLQESFIIPPRPKKQSRTKILENNAQLLMNNNRKTAHLSKTTATLQELLLDHGNALITEKKESFFSTASDAVLQEYTKLSEELSHTLDTCQRSVQNIMHKINTLTAASDTK